VSDQPTCDFHWHESEIQALQKARDAALADLSQARAEIEIWKTREYAAHNAYTQVKAQRDTANARAEAAEAQLAKVRHDRDEMIRVHDEVEADRDQLRDENARLKAECNARHGAQVGLGQELNRTQALLGRAVVILKSAYWDRAPFSIADTKKAEELLADPTATTAADAWRAQQEERAELEALIPFVRLAAEGCLTVRQQCEAGDAIAKVDARREEGGAK
jgi:chromosome segregation ATPase